MKHFQLSISFQWQGMGSSSAPPLQPGKVLGGLALKTEAASWNDSCFQHVFNVFSARPLASQRVTWCLSDCHCFSLSNRLLVSHVYNMWLKKGGNNATL